MMADTNGSGATPGGGQPEAIPQWKKELIQRRKNLAKTIGAAATQVHDSASTVAAALTTPTTPRAGPGVPFGTGLKAASVPSPSSLFGAPVFVGHSHSSPPQVNEQQQQQVLVKSFGGPTNTSTASATRGTTEVLLVVGGTSAEKQPLHTQSHSNDGTESTSSNTSGYSSRSNPNLPSSALSGTPKGGGGGAPANSSGPAGKYAAVGGVVGGISASSVDCEQLTNSYSNSEIAWKLKKNTSSASSLVSPNNSSSSGTKMVAASAEEIIYEKSRFVGEGLDAGTGTTVDVDTSEELKYGPGIVSKLRCRYLSLALRQSANKQRPSLNSMRRATSLNNLLDEESEDLSERENLIDDKDPSQDKSYQQGKLGRGLQHKQMNLQPKANTPDEYISTFQKSVQNSYTRSGRQTEKKNEYNRYNKQRGADSLKRARSVEALVRYDHKAWERDIQKENLYSSTDSNVIILDDIGSNGIATANGNAINNNCQSTAMNKAEIIVDCVTIEEKIINGREKGDPKPKRLTSFIDADERPPPDVVRQTMKIFEANANRRGRPIARTNGAAGEVAAKVASYKSIISLEKPPITHPKPPLSPKKPNIIPRNTSPKSNGNTNNNNNNNTANGLKDKPILPKLDITAIRYNLETTNNLKNAAASPPVQTPPSAGSNPNSTTSTPLSVRVEPAYRLKYDSPALSPNAAQHNNSKVTTNTTNRPESPRVSSATAVSANMQNNTNSTAHTFVDSPSIQALTSKLNQLNIATSTPTGTRSPTPSDPAITATANTAAAAPPQVPPRNILQYATSDEEDPDDPEDQQREYSINSDHGSDSQSDDLELDDEPDQVKKVSRSAMENISKAGITTQFRFNGQSQNKSHLPSLTVSSGNSTAAVGGGAKLIASKKLNVDDHLSSNSSSTSSSPITVPAAAAVGVAAAVPSAVILQKPPMPRSRESLVANGLKPPPPQAAANLENNNLGSVTANHNLNNLNSSNANTSVNSNGSKIVINANVGGNNGNTSGNPDNASSSAAAVVSAHSSVSSDVSKTVNLTAREIEKNQINLEKSCEESVLSSATGASVSKANNNSNNSNSSASGGGDVGAGVGSTTMATGGTSGGDFFMAKWGSPVVAPAPVATSSCSASSSTTSNTVFPMAPLKKKVKAPPPPIETNTVVFNFSNRKDVPDYIENDGIILRRPRELPKPGESGFVVLGDLTLETSTDPDDSWAMGPPSPCDVEFENANIVINGKSSMRNKTSRDNKFKIQFDDSLTSTFEYPSETSLLEANGFGGDSTLIGANGLGLTDAGNGQPAASSGAEGGGGGGGGEGGGGGGISFGDNGLLSHKNNLLSSMPLGSAPFASYTPVKAAIDTNFELGVTRTPSPSSTASSSTASSNSSSHATTANEYHPHQQQQQHHHHHQQHLIHPSNGGSQHGSNGTSLHHLQQQQQQQQQRLHHQINGTDGLLLVNGDPGEPESIQYLKPASDEQTVNWSQGTRVTDLLF
ncbi:serine-rich adhesin for platelets isoform X2 [Sabethes cyaneus]|uniref:serine-rich adhesin for platelets isoform X2 n=1 Tax=Sabethes cyaneus TaxID=53552 RepID=UPI00237D8F1F|nr:serine-rich adhesin for platelets isoform X2 [Sabethes cyaneus]